MLPILDYHYFKLSVTSTMTQKNGTPPKLWIGEIVQYKVDDHFFCQDKYYGCAHSQSFI